MSPGGVHVKFTVMRHAKIRSWPRHEHGSRAFIVDAALALRRDYTVDAHFWPGASPNERRLSSGAAGKVRVALEAFVGDFDCAEVHGTTHAVPDAWRVAEREKLQDLDAAHPGAVAYDSRGGYRVILALTEPVEIHDDEDVDAWIRFYRIALAYLARRFRMVGDPACSDWTRLFRLPHATRDPKTGPERRATFGDLDRIGVLEFDPSDQDIDKAAATLKPRGPRTLKFSANDGGTAGDGLLFHLLDAAGDMGSDAPRGGRVIRCPNRSKHTVASDWTDATVWYPPAAGKQIGAIFCQHAHCRDFTVKDWLGLYTDADKERARERAGIKPRERQAA
jgi:hypothetical protein